MSNQITPNPSVPSQVVAEVKFPKFINNLGIIPTSYKDSMSYYECLAWLCKFLEEQLIPTVNENGEAVEELQALYVELNSYVTNYFDNLDVQEEINNKLDEYVEDGTFDNILMNYLNVIRTYDTFEDFTDDISNLVSGMKILTLGYSNIDDGGGSYYYLSSTEVLGKYNISVSESLYAIPIFYDDYVSLKCFGCETNDDITSILNTLKNYYNKFLIDDTYQLNVVEISNIQKLYIKGNNGVIIPINTDSVNKCFSNSGHFEIENITFNCNNQKHTPIRNNDGSTAIIKNCNFINQLNTDNTSQTLIIFNYSGSDVKIENCNFENIKQKGDTTPGNNSGAGSCILVEDLTDHLTNNLTKLYVNNCYFKNCYNVDANGDPMVDDFDAIKIQNDTATNKNQITIENIKGRNISKRLIKIQSNNVTVNNVELLNDNTLQTNSIIQIEYNNHHVTNVTGKGNLISRALEILEANYVDISGINFENLATAYNNLNALFTIAQNCSNINISNCNGKGSSSGITIYGNTKFINISNINCETVYKALFIRTRSISTTSPSSGYDISYINFSNCIFKTQGLATDSFYDIEQLNSNHVSDVTFINSSLEVTNPTYQNGCILITADSTKFNGFKLKVANNTANVTQFRITLGKHNLNNVDIINDDTVPQCTFTGTSRIYANYLRSNSRISIGVTAKAILNYCEYSAISGDGVANSKINSFDMS